MNKYFVFCITMLTISLGSCFDNKEEDGIKVIWKYKRTQIFGGDQEVVANDSVLTLAERDTLKNILSGMGVFYLTDAKGEVWVDKKVINDLGDMQGIEVELKRRIKN